MLKVLAASPQKKPTIWSRTQVAIRGAPAKGIGREIDARVRISPAPPYKVAQTTQTGASCISLVCLQF